MFRVSAALLRGFALALDKPEDFFEAYFREDDTLSAVSLIRYPFLKEYPPVKVLFPAHFAFSFFHMSRLVWLSLSRWNRRPQVWL